MVKRTQRAKGVMGDETLSGLTRTPLKRLLSGALKTRPAGGASYSFGWCGAHTGFSIAMIAWCGMQPSVFDGGTGWFLLRFSSGPAALLLPHSSSGPGEAARQGAGGPREGAF